MSNSNSFIQNIVVSSCQFMALGGNSYNLSVPKNRIFLTAMFSNTHDLCLSYIVNLDDNTELENIEIYVTQTYANFPVIDNDKVFQFLNVVPYNTLYNNGSNGSMLVPNGATIQSLVALLPEWKISTYYWYVFEITKKLNNSI